MKRSATSNQIPQSEILLDAVKREGRFLSALRVQSADELIPWYNGENGKKEDHFFATVIASCSTCTHWRSCTHVKSHFQSTKDSKRLVHVYFFWKTILGKDFPVTDEMLLDKAWKNLDSCCEYGVKKENGHAKRSGGPVCLNPHHYSIADYRRMLQVLVECVTPIFQDNENVINLISSLNLYSRPSSEAEDMAKFQKFVYHLQQEAGSLKVVNRKKSKKARQGCETLSPLPQMLISAPAMACGTCGSDSCICGHRKPKRNNARAACVDDGEVKPLVVPTEITNVTDISMVDKLTQGMNVFNSAQLYSDFDLDFDTSTLRIPWNFLEEAGNYDMPSDLDENQFLDSVSFPSIHSEFDDVSQQLNQQASDCSAQQYMPCPTVPFMFPSPTAFSYPLGAINSMPQMHTMHNMHNMQPMPQQMHHQQQLQQQQQPMQAKHNDLDLTSLMSMRFDPMKSLSSTL